MTPARLVLAIGVAVMTVLFWPEGQAAIQVWRGSTAYGHCWLVLPIVLWLLWERRAALYAFPIRPTAWPALAALPLVFLWCAALVLGIMEGRQLAAMGLLLLFLLALLGPRLWWALSAGLLYLFFLVPFGAFLTPALQNFTAGFVGHGLDALGIPNDISALRIEIPEGSFYVAEACAGLRFLIASIAFGVLYAVTMFRDPWRRAAFIAASCVVPVIANGVRALGIVLLGHALGSAQAAAADHIIYGWVFFSAVILLLALAGLPFQQARAAMPAAATIPTPHPTRLALACVPVLLLASVGPIVAWRLDNLPIPTPPQGSIWLTPEGCTVSGQGFDCAGIVLQPKLVLLPRRSNPAHVVAVARSLASAGIANPDGSVMIVAHAAIPSWSLMMDQETGKAGAYVLWVDGAPALGDLRDRIRLGHDLLLGSRYAPLAVAVSAPEDGVAALQRFIAGQGDLAARLTRLSVGE